MRTSLNLPDELIRQAKNAALDAETTLTELIGDAIRSALSKPQHGKPRKELKPITYGEGGVCPGVDLDDTSALLDRMDSLDDPGRP